MDARSAAVDFRSRRGRPGASPHQPSAAFPNANFSTGSAYTNQPSPGPVGAVCTTHPSCHPDRKDR